MKLFKQLSKKLDIGSKKASNQGMIKPVDVDFDIHKNEFLDSLSRHALHLYERQCDIKNFTQLVLSNPENTSHNAIIDELFKKGVKDPLESKNLSKLTKNDKFLKDLGFFD